MSDSVLKNLTPNSRAIMVVHIAGISALVSKLKEIADLKGLALIEDCSQAHGAKINETNLGRFGDVSCWSFCQDKIMTTAGEGGMVSCKDEDLSERVRSFRSRQEFSDIRSRLETAISLELSLNPSFRWYERTHDLHSSSSRK